MKRISRKIPRMRENIDNKTGVTLRVSPLLDDLILSLDIRHNKEQKNKTVKILTFFCPESLLATSGNVFGHRVHLGPYVPLCSR